MTLTPTIAEKSTQCSVFSLRSNAYLFMPGAYHI